jgi:CRP/FNR family cyclic AMP-dependent transcriptional regulator
VLRAGGLFGEVATLDGGPSTATAVALYPSTLLVLRRDDLERYIGERPELAMRMLGELSKRLRRSDETIAELALCDVSERLIRRLRAIALQEGQAAPGGMLLQRPPTHQDLANMVGSCRETVCRSLKGLVRKGLLSTEGKTLLVSNLMASNA